MTGPPPGFPLPRASVVIATYERGPALRRLLEDLAAQSVAKDSFEVLIVDDGSKTPASEAVSGLELPYRLELVRQDNAGAAAARDRGARLARGEILVIVDDDMRLHPSFLEEHLRLHTGESRRVVLGPIQAGSGAATNVFERYNAHRLRSFGEAVASGRQKLLGNNLCTGNVSMRRVDYLEVGGFHRELRRSEDAELGLRLEEAGVEMVFAPAAPTFHDSDHSNARWLSRAFEYGKVDLRIARMHPEALHADPFRYYYMLPLLGRPFLWIALAMPAIGRVLARAMLGCASICDRLGARAVAMRGAGVAYGMEYFRGIRAEAGGGRRAFRSHARYLAVAAARDPLPPGVPRRRALLCKALRDLAIDRRTRHGYEAKYRGGVPGSWPSELLQKIGLQMCLAYRMMWFFQHARFPLFARMSSRMMRHLYGCDIHFEAELEAGVVFVHGMGICISSQARVGPGCILTQNVTLGTSIDPQSRVSGAPHLERDVHVGGGASLLGPITVGAGSKIMPNVVLTRSVPAGSIVEAPEPRVRPRLSAQAAKQD
ncbi:MAG TPA: glycosyltransferase [Myxococcales bacterium]|jgi:serine acetyltransferase/GT2 family glycosyltransferase